jgi:anti-sigma factor RsiW
MTVDCRRLGELLHDYIVGELPPEQLATLQAHIDQCPPCEIYVTTYRLTITMTRRLPPAEMPPDVAERLLNNLKKACGELECGEQD